MKQLNEIEVELKEFFPGLLPITRQPGYIVPDNYFNNLPLQVLLKVHQQELHNGASPIAVPENYFDDLPGKVINRIQFLKASRVSEVELELESVAPFLNQVTRENVYSVPTGYFQQLNLSSPETGDTKVVPMQRKAANFAQYLIAASILFVIALGTYLYTGTQPKSVEGNFNIEKSLQTVNDADIISYLQDNRDLAPDIKQTNSDFDFQSLIKNVSDEEIRTYLNDEADTGEKNIKGI